jgi:hypothetical protein
MWSLHDCSEQRRSRAYALLEMKNMSINEKKDVNSHCEAFQGKKADLFVRFSVRMVCKSMGYFAHSRAYIISIYNSCIYSKVGKVGADCPVKTGSLVPPLPNLYVPFVAAYGSHLPLFHDQSSFGTASAHPTFPLISYQVPLAHFLPGRVGFKTVTCSYPSVGTAFAVCTSHYSRTLSNIGPP